MSDLAWQGYKHNSKLVRVPTTTGEAWVSRIAAAAPTGTNEIPPIVGVPDLAEMCAGGPSSLTTYANAHTRCVEFDMAQAEARKDCWQEKTWHFARHVQNEQGVLGGGG